MKIAIHAATLAAATLLASCGGGGIGVRSAGNTSMHYKAGNDIVVNVYGNRADVAAEKTIDAAKVAAAANVAATGQGTAGAEGQPTAAQQPTEAVTAPVTETKPAAPAAVETPPES